jgi:hypothetical protein
MQLGFSGYVDGERAHVGGVVWAFDLIRDEQKWRVSRALSLNRNTTDYQELVTELPETTFPTSGELAASLPALFEELLRLPAPGSEAAAPSGV